MDRNFGSPMRRFRPVPGYPGYWCSDDGMIISTKNGVRALKPRRWGGTAHLKVDLYRNGRCQHWYISRLVAWIWLDTLPAEVSFDGNTLIWTANPTGVSGSPQNSAKLLVLHYDDNPLNNAVTNLRWGNHHENMLDFIRNSAPGRARDRTVAALFWAWCETWSLEPWAEVFNDRVMPRFDSVQDAWEFWTVFVQTAFAETTPQRYDQLRL